VRAESDPGRNLSIPMPSSEAGANSATTSNFPDFDALDLPNLPRDFGRNGTYLVLRQMVQDVDGFVRFTSEKAHEIHAKYGQLLRVAGGPVDADWVAAKLVGRWRDGTPLIDRSGAARPAGGHGRGRNRYDAADVRVVDVGRARRQNRTANPPGQNVPDNDFAYGEDDPTGLQCPLGAHIRRANPRDSLQPGDPEEQGITNRHRLLRRGRSYEQNAEKGLLFVALCADLERQFEFLQQTWVNSPSFHGLTDEVDPIAAPRCSADRVFTIPTASGPVILRNMQNFVTYKAGGYFFLPSRSTLEYLIELQPPAS
jgi:deferrochelatase/peroxidase EfeB